MACRRLLVASAGVRGPVQRSGGIGLLVADVRPSSGAGNGFVGVSLVGVTLAALAAAGVTLAALTAAGLTLAALATAGVPLGAGSGVGGGGRQGGGGGSARSAVA